MNITTVSLLTITQRSRNKCLKNLLDFILDQTYKDIVEWIIVEGSKTEKDVEENKEFIMNEIIIIKYIYNLLSIFGINQKLFLNNNDFLKIILSKLLLKNECLEIKIESVKILALLSKSNNFWDEIINFVDVEIIKSKNYFWLKNNYFKDFLNDSSEFSRAEFGITSLIFIPIPGLVP